MTSVSILVPTWCGGGLAEQAVASALAQTHQDLEVVVVDDASEDDTLARLERFTDDPRLVVHAHDENLGAAGNWNRGLAATSGDWVKLLCQDDLLTPDAIAVQLATARRGDVLVSSPRDVVGPNGGVLVRGRGLTGVGPLERTDVAARMLQAGTNVLGEPSGMLLHGDLARQTGFDARWSYCIDMAMWLEMLQHGTVSTTDQVTAQFRVTLGAWSATLADRQTAELERFGGEVLAPAAGRPFGAIDRLRIRRTTLARRCVYALLRIRHAVSRSG